MKKINNWFDKLLDKNRSFDLAMLITRCAFAGMLAFAHGLPKLINFSTKVATFADPLHIGSTMSLIGAIAAELFCSAFVLIGLGTRLFSLPVIFNMSVIVFLVQRSAIFDKQELGLVYLISFIVIFLLGPGKFSFDYLLKQGRR